MKEILLRAVRSVVNALLIWTLPLWGGVYLLFHFILSLTDEEDDSRDIVTGKLWFWS